MCLYSPGAELHHSSTTRFPSCCSWESDLASVADYIPTQFAHETVTHRGANRASCRAASNGAVGHLSLLEYIFLDAQLVYQPPAGGE